MEQGPVDVESLLRSCAERFEWQLREADADLRLELATLPAVQGDERRLEQAFTNLIDNALRYGLRRRTACCAWACTTRARTSRPRSCPGSLSASSSSTGTAVVAPAGRG